MNQQNKNEMKNTNSLNRDRLATFIERLVFFGWGFLICYLLKSL